MLHKRFLMSRFVLAGMILNLCLTLNSVSRAQDKPKAIKFKLAGKIESKSDGKSLEGVKIDLEKDKKVITSIATDKKGKYELTIDINSTDTLAAEYRVSYTKENMVPKTMNINTYIKKPVASSYDFNLDVSMTEKKEGDIIIDLPAGKIKWSVRENTFIFDQTYAKIIQKIKEQEDPEKKKKLIEEQKQREEEELRRRQEAERKQKAAEQKLKDDADKKSKDAADKAAEEAALKRQMEALRKQAEEFARQDSIKKAQDKAKDEADRATAKESLKKQLGALQKQVEEIKKEEVKPTAAAPTPAPVQAAEPAPVEDKGEQFIIKEVYSIRDVRALRGQKELLSKQFESRKIKNYETKYNTENPLTSLLNEIDGYEKIQKKAKSQ